MLLSALYTTSPLASTEAAQTETAEALLAVVPKAVTVAWHGMLTSTLAVMTPAAETVAATGTSIAPEKSTDCAEHETVAAQVITAPVFFGPPCSRAVALDVQLTVADDSLIASARAATLEVQDAVEDASRTRSHAAVTLELHARVADALWTRLTLTETDEDAAETAAPSKTCLTP